GGVHGLEEDEDAPAILGVKLGLEVGQLFHALAKQLLRLFAVELEARRVGGVVVVEPELLSLRDPVAVDELAGALRERVLHAPDSTSAIWPNPSSACFRIIPREETPMV